VADLLTIVEHGKPLPGLQLAWLGDCNNVLHSIIEAAGLMKFDVRVGAPEGYQPDERLVSRARSQGARITLTVDPVEAAAGADVLVTDTWVSMGQSHAAEKLAAMAPFQVNDALLAHAKADALFLHCLPAHVGEEVSESVIEGAQSVVFDEAENRIHAQKSILLWCFGMLPGGG
jgi:ornithine carbamoyltransferase